MKKVLLAGLFSAMAFGACAQGLSTSVTAFPAFWYLTSMLHSRAALKCRAPRRWTPRREPLFMTPIHSWVARLVPPVARSPREASFTPTEINSPPHSTRRQGRATRLVRSCWSPNMKELCARQAYRRARRSSARSSPMRLLALILGFPTRQLPPLSPP